LSWSGRGLLEMDGTRNVTWTPDEQVASVSSAYTPPGTAMSLAGSEQRIYDGYGRVVRIVRNGEVLDRVYAGAEVIREVSSCGERAWWPSGDLDEPVALRSRAGRAAALSGLRHGSSGPAEGSAAPSGLCRDWLVLFPRSDPRDRGCESPFHRPRAATTARPARRNRAYSRVSPGSPLPRRGPISVCRSPDWLAYAASSSNG